MLDRRVWNWLASYSGRIQSKRKINRQKSMLETGTNEVSLNTLRCVQVKMWILIFTVYQIILYRVGYITGTSSIIFHWYLLSLHVHLILCSSVDLALTRKTRRIFFDFEAVISRRAFWPIESCLVLLAKISGHSNYRFPNWIEGDRISLSQIHERKRCYSFNDTTSEIVE